MSRIFRILTYILTRIISIFRKKNAAMADEETPGNPTVIVASNTPRTLHESTRDSWKTNKEGLLRRPSLRRAAGLTDSAPDSTSNLRPGQRPPKPRTRSAKYLLRQGEYIENWNSPGCDLADLYGKKKPGSATPSPLLVNSDYPSPLTAFQNVGGQLFRFPSRSPTVSPEMETSCPSGVFSPNQNLRSPFLLSSSESGKSKCSPNPAEVLDLAQSILMAFKPVHSSNPALSATSSVFLDAPVIVTTASPMRMNYTDHVQIVPTVESLENLSKAFDISIASNDAVFCYSPPRFAVGDDVSRLGFYEDKQKINPKNDDHVGHEDMKYMEKDLMEADSNLFGAITTNR
ncbi:hypothetical protein AX17_006519 [Amanita inopinata Kibby_2008]|nr:hypothetical protein AX17_006519 [Amanita inopinata Kibby_2008]